MSKNRIKVSNPLMVKILLIVIIAVVVIAVLGLSIFVLTNSASANIYDLGTKKDSLDYKDVVLTSYSDYSKLINEYKVEKKLQEKDFEKHNYVASFQEYDPCAETSYRKVKKVDYDQGIVITFDVYNDCGSCKSKMLLYLIKVDKNIKSQIINYIYNNRNQNECGIIS